MTKPTIQEPWRGLAKLSRSTALKTTGRTTTRRSLVVASVVSIASIASIVGVPLGAMAATSKAKSPVKSTKAPTKAVAKSVLPSLTVLDLSTDTKVNLASFVDGKKPTLVWFWAPH